jgi:hypothetical protein
MSPVVSEGKTTGWLCWEHGQFTVQCRRGIVTGQEHDVMCRKTRPEIAELHGEYDQPEDPGYDASDEECGV